jgi:hypothetical protein
MAIESLTEKLLLAFTIVLLTIIIVISVLYGTNYNCPSCEKKEEISEIAQNLDIEEVINPIISAEETISSMDNLTYSVDVQMELIQLISTQLQKWGVMHYVAYGSLIGLLRDGKPLINDHDSDINVFGPHINTIVEKLSFLSSKGLEIIRKYKIDMDSYRSDANDSLISLKYKNNYIDLYGTSWMPRTETFSNKYFTDILIPVNPWDHLESIYKNPREPDGQDRGNNFLADGNSVIRQPGRNTNYFKNNVFIDFQ